jgi:predicted AlkP superfamily phosphohydrolase/phosphomutase
LRTAYSASPVIWTTIATGVSPRVHGIMDFVVATESGDVPISSSVRRVPALWNMLSSANRRVGVVGWWASWPAETIHGVVISDRVLDDVPRRVSPEEVEAELAADLLAAEADQSAVRGEGTVERRDRATCYFAERLLEQDFDLLLVYFRDPDITSHLFWKAFEPEKFSHSPAEITPEDAARIPNAYENIDRALGRLLTAAAADTNVLLISDHGFRAAKEEELVVDSSVDVVLEHLGYLVRNPAGVDAKQSRLYTHATRPNHRAKKLRFGGAAGDDRAALIAALRRDLEAVTFETGERAFRVREATRKEQEEGADVMVDVLGDGATLGLLIGGELVHGGISALATFSGTHTKSNHGILLAAGPDIDPDAMLDGIRVQDIAPTLLYGLGLPVAEDFVGIARTELFTQTFRRRHHLRTIPTWGQREAEGATPSAVDQKILDELKALGYL